MGVEPQSPKALLVVDDPGQSFTGAVRGSLVVGGKDDSVFQSWCEA